MKNVISKALLILFCSLLIPSSFAQTLQDANSSGIVGELRNGYVGLVVEPVAAEVLAMVRDINNQRRDLYRQIAQQNGLSTEQVAALAYEKAVEATPAGQYIQDSTGAWVKK